MTLGVSNVSRIHFGFKFIVNPDLDPIIEYALSHNFSMADQRITCIKKPTTLNVPGLSRRQSVQCVGTTC